LAQFGWPWRRRGDSHYKPGRILAQTAANAARPLSSGLVVPTTKLLAIGSFTAKATPKRNSTRLPLVEALDQSRWEGERAAHFKNGSFHLVPAGHWLQSDMPKQVAGLMLS
jgi:hypothetical protein